MFLGSIASKIREGRLFYNFILGTVAFAALGSTASAQWVTAYYINTAISVNDIPWSKATHVIDYAVNPADNSGNLTGIAGSDADAFTAAAHAAGKKALLCVRDADGATARFGLSITNNLSGFAGNIVNFVNTHNYDGVDFDWEAGNFNSGDNVNYTNLITAVRNLMGSGKLITMSVYWNFGLANVVQTSANNLNQVNIMCYDMDQWNSDIYYNLATTSAAGDTTHNSCALQASNFAGYIAKSKIGLGIPFYGRVWNGCADSGCTDGLHSLGQTWSSENNSPISYASLVASSYWSQPHQWDSVHGASYISIDQPGASNDRFISYTDGQQINAMVQLMRSQGYGGVMEYEVDYDFMPSQSGDARHPLATAVWSAVFGSSSGTGSATGSGSGTNSGGSTTPPAISAPVITSGSPSGTLAASTTQTTMSVSTNEAATCKYATTAGMAYASMPSTFSTTGGTSHVTNISGLTSGNTYAYFIRCSTSGVADTSDYQVSFSVAAPPAASSSVTVSPASGSGSSQNFNVQIVDSNGASSLTQVDLIIGTVGATNSCWAEYAPGNKTMYLRDDSNNWMSAALGSTSSLQNSQCTLNASTSTVSSSGAGTQLAVNFAMSFTAAYVGAHQVQTFIADSAGWVTGFVTEGTYNVTAPPARQGLSLQLSPTSGSGNTAKLTIRANDSAGFSAIQQLNLFIGNNMGGPNQCYLDYEAPSRTLYLMSSDNSHWMSGTIGAGGLLQNNSCTIHLNSVMAVGGGTTLTLAIPVTFNASVFGGNQAVLVFGADKSGVSTGWQNAGTWTVTK